MGMTQYISASEAVALAGVSQKTLERFTEAGYLRVERESDGLLLYSSEELKQIFGTNHVPCKPFPVQERPRKKADSPAEQKVTKEPEPVHVKAMPTKSSSESFYSTPTPPQPTRRSSPKKASRKLTPSSIDFQEPRKVQEPPKEREPSKGQKEQRPKRSRASFTYRSHRRESTPR